MYIYLGVEDYVAIRALDGPEEKRSQVRLHGHRYYYFPGVVSGRLDLMTSFWRVPSPPPPSETRTDASAAL